MEAFPLRARRSRRAPHDHRAPQRVAGAAPAKRRRACGAVRWMSVAEPARSCAVLNAPLAQPPNKRLAAQGSDASLPEALARSGIAFVRLAHASSLAPPDQQAALTAAGPSPPPAGRSRGPHSARTNHSRARRAVLHIDDRRLRLRALDRPAAPARSGLGVHRARRIAPVERACVTPTALRRPRAVRRRCRVRVLPRPPAGGRGSYRASTTVPSTCSFRRGPITASNS